MPYHPTAQTVRPSALNANARSLAARLMIATVPDPTKHVVHSAAAIRSRRTGSPQEAEIGQRMARLSAIDILRECVRQDISAVLGPGEACDGRAATSGGTLAHVFSTSVYAKIVEG